MSWTEPAEASVSTYEEPALEGAGEEQALEGTGELQALEGTGEVQALEGTGEVQALEGTGEVQALEGTGEVQALEGTGEVQALEGTGEVQALEGTVSEQALEGAGEVQALEGTVSEQALEGAVSEQALEGAVSEQALEGAVSEQAPEGAVSEQALEGAVSEQALEGAVSEQALEGAGEVQALEGAGEEQAQEGAGKEQTLEGAGEEQAQEGAGEEQAQEGAGEDQAPENLKPPQGWTGPAGTTGRGEGASRTPAQSPSQVIPPPCPAVPAVLSAPSPPWCSGRSSTPHSHYPRQAPTWWALSPALAPDLTGWAGPAATKMSWAEPVENPASLRESRIVRGLRWPRMAADLPQTAGWTSRRRRRRFPANGEHGRAAGGGDPLPREQNQETKTLKNGRKTKPDGSGAEVTVFLGGLFCHDSVRGGCTEEPGTRNAETRNFFEYI